MRKKIFNIIKFSFLLGFGIFLLFVFVPRKYNVPKIQKRESTKYWDLPTGSRIGYVLIPAKGIKKSYPIIYLHGGPGGIITDETIKMLSPLSENGYDVYLYDQIGSGHSGRLKNIEEYTVDRHKRDLEEIIMKTGARKVILIGQSWGAMLATQFLADNPEKVEKLILTGPGPILPVRQELAGIKVPDSIRLKEPLYSNRQANKKTWSLRIKAISLWAIILGSKLASDKEADDFQTYLTNELNKSTVCDTPNALKAEGGNGFYAHLMTLQSFNRVKDPRPRLKNIHIPVLVMKGECDNQKWGYTNEYLEFFPNHRLVIIPGAGHSIAVEQPKLYLNVIREFLNE